jgi:F0F1-type ATP synthase delta subunit
MTLAEQIIARLDANTETLSIEQLLGELQIAVERVGFAAATRDVAKMTQDEVDLLFEGQLSNEILEFIYWLQSSKLLIVLSGETGRRFLNHCLKRYRGIQQVRFLTAVPLAVETKQHIATTLMPAYPAGARLLFEVDPSIVAGFRLDDSVRLVDKTMRTAVMKLTRQKLMETARG